MPRVTASPGSAPPSRAAVPVRTWAGVAAVIGLALALLSPTSVGAAGDEWNIARVKAPMSASGTVIAVVDTGVDRFHPAFGNRVLPQLDFVGDGKSGDPEGHGTHVSGTAAGAATNNGCSTGAIGVAPDAKILPVRVLDANGEGYLDDVADGIRAAADKGATVINLSLGSDVAIRAVNNGGTTLRDAIAYAWGKGSIPVLAAGNDGITGALLGSGYSDIKAVVVTATDNQDRVAGYATSIGSAEWGIAAPGGDGSKQAGRDILSAFPEGQCALSAGTSMATPHVAGALAVLRARGLNPQQAVDRLLSTARDLGASGDDGTYGSGLLDLAAAVKGLGGSGTPAPTTQPQPAPAVTTTAPAQSAGGSPTTAVPSGGVPATRPATTTTSSSADVAVDDEPDDGDTDATAVGSGTGDGADADLTPVDDDAEERAAGPGGGDDDTRAPGAPLVACAALLCAAGWALAGRAALSARS